MSRRTMKAPRRADNLGISFKLAEAVSEAANPAASPSNAIVAARLFAIAPSLDRPLVFFEILAQEDRAKNRAQGTVG